MNVRSLDGSATVAARCSSIASPDFMSVVPQPCKISPSTRDGTLSAIGTVSMCPASNTRVGWPSEVRASTALPERITSNFSPSPRSAASMASASGPSAPETDAISTSDAVSPAGSVFRSSDMCGTVPAGRGAAPRHRRQVPLVGRGRPNPAAVASNVGQVRRSVVVSAVVVGALVVVGGAAFFGIRALTADSGPECHVPDTRAAGAVGVDLDAVQYQHAATINAVGLGRGLPEQARVIALATGLQESSLRNLDHGDRDSLGLFQQRPSQGWGEPTEIMDPVYASGKFYDALVQVPDWQTLSVTQAAQAVQYSAYPDAYAKWADEATILAGDLGGGQDPQGSCRAGAQPVTAEAPDRSPVT